MISLPAGMTVLERGWLSANNIVFIDGARTAIVDTGYCTHAEQTLALVDATLAASGRTRLDLIVNTHLHSDHCGGNAALQARHGCATWIPEAEWEAVRDWDAARLSFDATGQQCPRFAADAALTPGAAVSLGGMDWEVLGAPGHDPHAVMLFQADTGILIAGDALWRDGFGVVFPEIDGESGFAEVRATLDLIASLPVTCVIPGHGSPFVEVDAALATAYSRLDYLAADPQRNAMHALKVLIKFKLLDCREIALDALLAWMAGARLFTAMRERHLRAPIAELAESAIAGLIRAGAARREGARLIDAG